MLEKILPYLFGTGVIGAIIAIAFVLIKKFGKTELARDILQEVIENNQKASKEAKQNAKEISKLSYDDVIDRLSK